MYTRNCKSWRRLGPSRKLDIFQIVPAKLDKRQFDYREKVNENFGENSDAHSSMKYYWGR